MVNVYPIEQRTTGLGKGETEIICLFVRVIVMSDLWKYRAIREMKLEEERRKKWAEDKKENEEGLEEEDYDC